MKKIAAALLVLAIPAAHAESICDGTSGFDKALCVSAASAAVIIGGGGYLGEAIFSAIMPLTAVTVTLPSGEQLTGKATRKMLYDRELKPGQPLTLSCKVNTPALAGDYGFASCNLTFPAVAPKPQSQDYYEREGKQPSWGFGANKEGFTDPSLLTLSRPLVWDQGVGR